MNEFFETIYYENKDDIYRLALSYTQNKYDAEDITQRTFIKAYKNINNIEKDNNVKQYLLTIAANECKDLFKSFWRKRIVTITDNEINNINNQNNYKDLFEILKNIPSKYRICIHLYYFYGYSIKEIASIENIKENTAKTRLARGRLIIKNELERKNINEKDL